MREGQHPMMPSRPGWYAPMVCVLLLLIVTPARAGANGKQYAAAVLALEAAPDWHLVEQLSFGHLNRMLAFQAASDFDAAPLAIQSPQRPLLARQFRRIN